MVDMDRTDEDRADKGRIRFVGTAGYADDGRQRLEHWQVEGNGDGVGFNLSAHGPDEPVIGGWTFRELHAIANGTGPNVEPVRSVDPLPSVTCASCGRKSPWCYGDPPSAYVCGECAGPVSAIVIEA